MKIDKSKATKLFIIVLAVATVVLSALILRRVMKRCNCEQYSPQTRIVQTDMMRRMGFNPRTEMNATFVPVGNSGGSWPNPDDQQKCLNAFAQVDMSCQSNPNSDTIACSDYPMFYCDGALRPSGDLDKGNCSYGSAIAYSSDDCTNPRTTLTNGSYLCGGNLGPCDVKICKESAPQNPWGATNICKFN